MRQLDLFLDTPGTIAFNELRDALTVRDADRAGNSLERLASHDADPRLAADAKTLIAVMAAPAPEGVGQGFEWLHSLEREWLQAADALLGVDGGRDFLVPMWRCAGRALESAPFDPVCPKRHASWAYLQGRDWTNLKRSVLAVEGYETAPVLLARLAEAEWRQGNRAQAVEHWFALCWQAPVAFEELVEAADFPDGEMAAAWRLAQDQDVEPALSPEWFPAFLLLQEPRLAGKFASGDEKDGPRRALDVVRALITTHGDHKQSIALRRELKTLHPGLLSHYLQKFARP